MKKVSHLLIIGLVLVFALISIMSAVSYYNKEVDVRKVKTEMSINTDEFLKDFNNTNDDSFKQYIEKAIEIKGTIHKVTFKKDIYTLLLQGNELDTFVICEMQHYQNEVLSQLQEGDEVKVKGILKGFLKDAILLNCIILNKADE